MKLAGRYFKYEYQDGEIEYSKVIRDNEPDESISYNVASPSLTATITEINYSGDCIRFDIENDKDQIRFYTNEVFYYDYKCIEITEDEWNDAYEKALLLLKPFVSRERKIKGLI